MSESQNLVPNWSFESYTLCPNASSQLPSATPWFGPSTNSADYYNACAPIHQLNVPYQGGAGFQYAKDGNALAAIYCLNGYGVDYRENLQVQLTDSLTNGKCYFVEFFANVHNYSRYGVNNVAANFSKNACAITSTPAPLNIPMHITRYGNPIIKDTLNWVQVAGVYTATGGEQFITIGNFKNDNVTDTISVHSPSTGNCGCCYMLIDAVSVYSINPTGTLPWTYTNTSVAIGDSVYIGNYLGGGFTSNWYTYGGTFINSGSGIYVKPVTTSTFVVQFTICGVPRSDTLKVSITGVGINELSNKSVFRISPNPTNSILNIEIFNKEFRKENAEIEITNTLGQTILMLPYKNEIDVSEL